MALATYGILKCRALDSKINLLNAPGIKVYGVSYAKEQAQKQGCTIVF
jgi:hypothetical protein